MEVELIPNDTTWEEIAKHFGTSISEVKVAMKKSGVIQNLKGTIGFSYYYVQTTNPDDEEIVFPYSLAEGTIDKIVYIIHKDGNKWEISGFPMQPRQLELISKVLQEFNDWARLPTDIFYKIIEDGAIRGKDLISLCVANPRINDLCNSRNQELFRRLLMKDYRQTPRDPSKGFRAQYVELYERKLAIYLNSERVSLDFDITGVKQIACSGNFIVFIDKRNKLWRIDEEGAYEMKHPDFKVSQVSLQNEIIYVVDMHGRLYRDGIHIPDIKDVKYITSGHNNSAFIDGSGRLWTVGGNEFGQLGHGDFRKHKLRVVEGFEGVKQVAYGTNHMCFIDSDDRLWSCGNNDRGQLGHDYAETSEPWMIPNLPEIRQVSCGDKHTMCIDLDGNLWAFGDNTYTQLGSTGIGAVRVPTLVPEIQDEVVVKVACGDNHTAILTYAGGFVNMQISGLLSRNPDLSFRHTAQFVLRNSNVNDVVCGQNKDGTLEVLIE